MSAILAVRGFHESTTCFQYQYFFGRFAVTTAIVSAVGRYDKWPFIITEVTLDNGIVGNSYICPYLVNFTDPIERVIQELFKLFENQPLAPAAFYEIGMSRLSLLGRSGIAMYALAAPSILHSGMRVLKMQTDHCVNI